MCFHFDWHGNKAKLEKENPINQIFKYYEFEKEYRRLVKQENKAKENGMYSTNPESLQYFALMEVLWATIAESDLKRKNKILFYDSLKDNFHREKFLKELNKNGIELPIFENKIPKELLEYMET